MNENIPDRGEFTPGGKNLDSINPNPSVNPPTIIVSQRSNEPKEVNLLKVKQKRPRFSRLKKFFLLILLLLALFFGMVFFRASSLSQKIFVGQKTTFLAKIVDLIRGGDNGRLIGEDLGQINILLLGIGGEGHDGPYLTDTMILAQIRPDIGEATLTSIPRDYLVTMPNGGQDKINSAFTYGYITNKDWDQGGAYARKVVENISGLKVPYFAIVDFSGFEEAVDRLGGLDITVDRTFTDNTYPDNGIGYLPPITFEAGQQHLNGKKALQFARSRHGNNNEGSDFARSVRQQKIISSFKQKVLTLNIVKNASDLNSLISIFADHFHTNLTPGGLLRIYNLTKGNEMQILASSLDPETGLICPLILASNGAYVLTPCRGKSEQDIQNFFQNSFAIGKLTAEKSIVWLANSTSNPDRYNTAFRKLTNAGLLVYELTYTKDNLPQTIVYQVNEKPATAEFVKNQLKASEVNLPPPGVNPSKDRVDVIVVLGQNAPVEAAPPAYIPPPARIPTTTTSTVESVEPKTDKEDN